MKPIRHVGLDFGTSNTVLSYLQDGVPTAFMPGRGDDYGVPTIVAPEPADLGERIWGFLARHMEGAARNFKLGLSSWAGKRDDPRFKNTRAFLAALFAEFSRVGRLDAVDKMAVTIPELWFSERYIGGKKALSAILSEYGRLRDPATPGRVGEPIFISEPVAACCYYAWRRRRYNPEADPFSGYVFVYDHGGGTLDLSLCRVDGVHIERVHGADQSEKSQEGYGGASYDREVLAALRKKYPSSALPRNATDERLWLAEFEAKRRYTAPMIAERYRSEFTRQRDQQLFTVKGTPITLGLLDDTFDNWFSSTLHKSLDEFLNQCKRRCPDFRIEDASSFKVLMVGGFSEFFPVRRAVRHYFTMRAGSADVVSDELDPGERMQAVSFGAALVAGDVVKLNQYPPFTFGVIYYVGEEQFHEPLIPKNVPLAFFTEPQISNLALHVAELTGETPIVSFYYEIIDGERLPLPLRLPLEQVLPNYPHAKTWKFGCQVRAGNIELLIVPASGKKITRAVGKFFDVRQSLEFR